MSCSTNITFLPPPPPPPPTSESVPWLLLGVFLAIISSGLIVLGTVVQRYGLIVVRQDGCCGKTSSGCSNSVWLSGWVIYVAGNGVYTYAVTMAPATLCSALLGTAVVWNGIIARFILGERLELCDVHGGILILTGIALSQTFGPSGSTNHTAWEFLELFADPAGALYLAIHVLVLLVLMLRLVLEEKKSATVASNDGASGSSNPNNNNAVPSSSATVVSSVLIAMQYPVVVGMIEALQQLCLIAASRMFWRSAAGDSQLCHGAFWASWIALFAMCIGQVWWLRKALLRLEVKRVLPVEYGTQSSLSMIGSLLFLQERHFVENADMAGILCGIALIVMGCVLVGARFTPVPPLPCCPEGRVKDQRSEVTVVAAPSGLEVGSPSYQPPSVSLTPMAHARFDAL